MNASYALRAINRATFTAPADGWREHAACRDSSTAAFFPDRDGASNRNPALKVCRRCPVIEDCLEFALYVEADATSQMRFGIWGGTWPAERKRIANARRAAVA